ncbi:ribosome silencing factor [Cellvibrio polysaccharolyticus]|uniref:Ribosomal silencing factor RsfS n=1 Tax=Cellvibrio polysaccharolyticus TaxID=2082724 RepID=A0A928V8J4_9GAMM|nr:ribosome silencing factor [Cellvibrio polysaccharolyticus]MBE8718464.1 ribosome silencing factor [Cellvibrio polysaccharolyticus]
MSEALNQLVITALEDLKGQNIVQLDVRELSDVMDTLIIASGTSSRHARSMASNLVEESKKQGHRPIGVEGIDAGDWVLVDYGDTVVHVMQQETRDFYELEKLWSMKPAGRE